jgi:hypothetical protein
LEGRSKNGEGLHTSTDAFEAHTLLFLAPLFGKITLGRRYVELWQETAKMKCFALKYYRLSYTSILPW